MVSVIIPAYNVERYIGACLDSVLAQKDVDFEIIVVDDESTDSTMQIVSGYAAAHKCIRAVPRSHGGLSAVRNTALQLCRGEWITMVDSDDLLAEGALKTMLDIATSGNDIDIVAGGWKKFHGQFVTPPSRPTGITLLSGKEATEIMLYKKRCHNTVNSSACGKLYRSTLWRDTTFCEGIIYEDLQLIPRLCVRARCVAVTDCTVYGYRHNENSILHTFSEQRLDALKVTEDLCRHFADDPDLYKAARSRHFSAAFNLWLLMNANRAGLPRHVASCRKIIRSLAGSQIAGGKVRLKNRIGALLQYLPFIFTSPYICKKLLSK